MDKECLRRLEMLNQLELTDEHKDYMISFFKTRDEELKELDAINTENVERMVHVIPVMTVVRNDVIIQNYTPEELQKGAVDTDEGYWCVPKVMD